MFAESIKNANLYRNASPEGTSSDITSTAPAYTIVRVTLKRNGRPLILTQWPRGHATQSTQVRRCRPNNSNCAQQLEHDNTPSLVIIYSSVAARATATATPNPVPSGPTYH